MIKRLNNLSHRNFNILEIFFKSPTKEFNVRETARIMGVAPASVSTYLKGFAKQGILKERKERNLILYKANLDSEEYLDLKVYYNVRIIKESGLIEELNKFYFKPAIVLFGSASEGLDVEDSDIDLVIVSEINKEFKLIKDFEKKLNRHLHLFIVRNLKELKNEHLINNVLNGIVIQGRIKWI